MSEIIDGWFLESHRVTSGRTITIEYFKSCILRKSSGSGRNTSRRNHRKNVDNRIRSWICKISSTAQCRPKANRAFSTLLHQFRVQVTKSQRTKPTKQTKNNPQQQKLVHSSGHNIVRSEHNQVKTLKKSISQYFQFWKDINCNIPTM